MFSNATLLHAVNDIHVGRQNLWLRHSELAGAIVAIVAKGGLRLAQTLHCGLLTAVPVPASQAQDESAKDASGASAASTTCQRNLDLQHDRVTHVVKQCLLSPVARLWPAMLAMASHVKDCGTLGLVAILLLANRFGMQLPHDFECLNGKRHNKNVYFVLGICMSH